jgi:hypothetical protein
MLLQRHMSMFLIVMFINRKLEFRDQETVAGSIGLQFLHHYWSLLGYL